MKLKAEKRFSVDPRGFFCFIDTSDFDVANAQYSNIAFVTTKDVIIGFDRFQDRIFYVLEILSPYVLSLNCAISYEASQLRTLVSISFHHFEMNTPRINLIFSRRLIMSLVDGERQFTDDMVNAAIKKVEREIRFCVDDMSTAKMSTDDWLNRFIDFVIDIIRKRFNGDVLVSSQYSPRFLTTLIVIRFSIEGGLLDEFKNELMKNEFYASTMKWIEAGKGIKYDTGL